LHKSRMQFSESEISIVVHLELCPRFRLIINQRVMRGSFIFFSEVQKF